MIQKLRNKFGKGFTLIELMIVIWIIGILVAIFVPNLIKYREARSKDKIEVVETKKEIQKPEDVKPDPVKEENKNEEFKKL